jgi:DNA-binding NarL/FixJ family response regulator
MRTGLGFGLWVSGGDEADEKTATDDLSSHNIYAIRERMQITYTNLVKRGFSTGEIAQKMGTSEQTVQYYLNGIFDEINRFEKALGAI